MQVFVSADGDGIGKFIGIARLNDDVAEVRRIDQCITAGNKLFESFALRSLGSVVEAGGDEIAFLLPPDKLSELPAICEQYFLAVGATVSVGVGLKLSESSKALMVAKLRGKNQIVLYHPDQEAEIAAVGPQTEADKLSEEYLQKGGEGSGRYDHHLHGIRGARPGHGDGYHPGGNKGAHAGFGGHKVPHREHGQHEEGAEAVKQAVEAKHAMEALQPQTPNYENDFHVEASKQGDQDQQDAHAASGAKDDLRQQLAAILSNVREKGAIISQLQQVDPDAYAAILNLVQGVIALGREVLGPNEDTQDQSQPVQKSEGRRIYRFTNESDADDFYHTAKRFVVDGRKEEDGKGHVIHLGPTIEIVASYELDLADLDGQAKDLGAEIEEVKEAVEFDKSGGPIDGQNTSRMSLPVGSQVNGKIKVVHGADEGGGESWIEARSGKALGSDGHVVPASQTKAR